MVAGVLPGWAEDHPVAPAAAATPPAAEVAGKGPKIQFATPVYDFGRVQAGEMVKYTYMFTNIGEETLELSNVQPSCGCTTAGDWTKSVAAGGTGKVSVQFNSANFNGPVLKTVTVTSNEKQKPVTVLQLKGTVWKPIELVPQYTVLTVPPDAPSASATVRIVNHLDEPLDVFSPVSSNPAFSAVLITNQPGKEYQINLTSAGELNSGNVQGKVTLKTSSAKTPTLDVPFWANVQPIISVIPPRIMLPQAPLKVKAPMTVTIQNNSTNALTLSEPSVNAPGVDVQLKEVQPGRLYNAVLTFPENFELRQDMGIALTLKSSQPRMPEIRVPVAQMARPVVAPPPTAPAKPAASGAVAPTSSAQAAR
jgi:hypothetical protein